MPTLVSKYCLASTFRLQRQRLMCQNDRTQNKVLDAKALILLKVHTCKSLAFNPQILKKTKQKKK